MALFNDYEGGRSSAAELESHNPYFDSSNVSCTATSCEDDEVVSLDGSCSLSVTSIRLDPEVDALNNVYCEFNLVGGKVYVGLNDGSCTPSESTLDYEVCGGAGSCSGSFYYSITKDMLYDNRPTYLVLVVERSCTYPTCDAATFYVKGIKPEWIDVGIETEGGGMSEDSCGNWVDTSGSCTCTTSCDDVAYVPVVDSDTDQDGCWDDEFVLGPAGAQGEQGVQGATSPVNAGFLVISGQGLPAQGSISIQYTASAPGMAPPEGSSLRIMTASGGYVAPGSYNLNGSGCITVNGESANLSLLRVVEFSNGGLPTPQNIRVTLNGAASIVASDTVLVDPLANMKVYFLHSTGTYYTTGLSLESPGPFPMGHSALGFEMPDGTMEVYDFLPGVGDQYQHLALNLWLRSQAQHCPVGKAFKVECIKLDVTASEALSLLELVATQHRGLTYSMFATHGYNCNTIICHDLDAVTSIHVPHSTLPEARAIAFLIAVCGSSLLPGGAPAAMVAGWEAQGLCTYDRWGFFTEHWLTIKGHNGGSWTMEFGGWAP